MNYDGDVNIIFKTEIDNSDASKDMEKFANSTKAHLEQSISSFDKQIHNSVQSLQKALSTIEKDASGATRPIFEQAQVASKEVESLLKSIRQFSEVDKIDAQVYELGQKLSKAAEDMVKLQPSVEAVEQTAKLSDEFYSIYGNIENAENKLQELEALEKELWQSVLSSGAKAGPLNLEPMTEAYNNMQEYRTEIQKAQEDIVRLNQSGEKGTEAWNEELQKTQATLSEFISKLGVASKEFYSIGRKADFGSSKEEILDTYNTVTKWKETRDAVDNLKFSIKEVKGESIKAEMAMKDMARLSTVFDTAKQAMHGLADATQQVDTNVEHVNANMSNMRNAVWSVSRVLGNVYTIGLDVWRGAKMIANIYNKIWGYVKKIAGLFKQLRENVKKTGDEHKKSWAKMLKDVIRYSLGIRSLFMLFRRLRGYIKEAFKAMAEQIPEVNQTLSELKSSFNMLKGSLATAFEPLISALAPALLRLINLFATLLTYVGMFFAAITGRGYVYKANKSMTSFADAAGGAADNVKELNKQLQGFDELNNLTTNENKDAGGAGAGPLANFEKVPVLDWIKDLADKIREIFERIMEPIKRAWAKVGDYVVAAWKRAFNSVKDLLLDIGRDFLKAWDKMGESIATNFLLIVGDVGNIIANIADSLREAWNYNENGYKIWMAILTIIDKVLAGIRRITKDMRDWSAQLNVTPAMTSFREWLESCEPVVESLMGVLFDFWNDALKPILTWAFDGENSGIARLFRIFRDFNKKVDWNKLRKNLDKIWKALGRFGETIGEGLLLFLERLSDRLADWVNSGDFERTCDKIVEFFDSIKSEDIADDLDSILRDVKNIVEELKKPIKWVWEHKDQILSWLEKITSHIDTLAKVAVFGKLAIDLARFGANLYLMVSAIEKLTGAEGLGKIAGMVSSAFGEQGLSGVIALATEKLGGFMSTIGPVVTHIALIVLYIMWLKNEFKYLYENHETFRQSVDETISLIQDNIDSIIDNFKDIKENLDEISEKMGPIKDKLYEAFGSPATGILMTFGNLVLFITGLFSTLLGVLDAIVQFINGDFQGAFQSISDTWNRMKENFTQLAENVKTHLSDIATALSLLNPTVAAFVQTLKGIIELIGYAIDGIKNLRDNMSGGSISSSIFGRAQSVSVPRLAQGAVIPPNNEFLAVLGDQKRGTNIESPLSTMVEAFNMANKGGSEQEIALLQEQNDLLRQLLQKEFGISNEAIFRSVRQSNSQYRKQTGTSAFA